ncbi:hypothetical protein KL948_002398 [Ogataea haglerorum]|uniref:uncharacterized protein n=1 Tax=Ogataea haglerorum TaxID=1937702 RepID=UPI001C8A3512|nr:uncharacterized protein KL911_002103 [Ogataea haglerorum]KAG7696953.1 hypothetical protein KL915_002216 [Ogataea haglerorum]KAG7707625.1 hypothetical protein KL914_002446 [Ogataea haglerorum]KAG7709661.1 hypothetical protein KL950_001880 [Ogataea haglerorum]KAG7732200.1 hypothetical protein KL948_002398 [Ogataea haglerorum]KAG7738680.1 hypothetical protein KL932_003573 [Ogataea haglerorum]
MLENAVHSLQIRPSRLDLIDNKQLTSFPLPHPNLAQTSPHGELLLVEDYIHYPKGFRKKASLFDIKRAIDNDMTPPDALLPLYYRKQSVNSSSTLNSETEAYIKTTDSNLRYCVVCDRPLYDLSSLLPRSRCAEIVCCHCFQEYEILQAALKKIDPGLAHLFSDTESENTPETVNPDFSVADQTAETLETARDTSNTVCLHTSQTDSATFDAIISTLRRIQVEDEIARTHPRRKSSPMRSLLSLRSRLSLRT